MLNESSFSIINIFADPVNAQRISFILAVIPAVFLLFVCLAYDARKSEPIGLILKVFILGCLAIIPVVVLDKLLIHLATSNAWGSLFVAALQSLSTAALLQESIKWLIIKHAVYDNVHFDEVMDGITYGMVVGLGFACMENILFVTGKSIEVAYIRAFTTIPVHVAGSGLTGFYIGCSKFARTQREQNLLIWWSFLIGLLVHGAYSFVLLLDWDKNYSLLVFLTTMIFLPSVLFLYNMILRAQEMDRDREIRLR